MSVDLIDGNNTRYYSVPDSADWTFPDSDWFIYLWTKVDENSGSAFQYLFSNNTFGSANSVNILLSESSAANPGKWSIKTENTEVFTTSAPGADGVRRLVCFQRDGDNLEAFFVEEHQTASGQGEQSYSDGAINGGVVNIGRRVDGNTARYYEEHFGDVVKGTGALSIAQLTLLGQGVSPVDVIGYDNLDIWLQFREATSQVVDIINGNIATRQGSGLLTSEHFPVVHSFNNAVPEADAGQSIAVTQVVETNIAQAIVAGIGAVSILVGQVTEIDIAQPITPLNALIIEVGQVVETNTAQAITALAGNLDIPVNQVTETNIAQAVTVDTGGAVISVNQVIETDIAQAVVALAGNLDIPVNQVSEVNIAQPVTALQGIAVAVLQVVETNIAQSVTVGFGEVSIIVGQVVETNIAQSVVAFNGVELTNFKVLLTTENISANLTTENISANITTQNISANLTT